MLIKNENENLGSGEEKMKLKNFYVSEKSDLFLCSGLCFFKKISNLGGD